MTTMTTYHQLLMQPQRRVNSHDTRRHGFRRWRLWIKTFSNETVPNTIIQQLHGLCHARCRGSGRNTGACWMIDLGRCCAIQATLLAPSKQAGSLAILEAIVCSHCIAFGARRTDANGASQAAVELVVVDA